MLKVYGTQRFKGSAKSAISRHRNKAWKKKENENGWKSNLTFSEIYNPRVSLLLRIYKHEDFSLFSSQLFFSSFLPCGLSVYGS
jgi:hypothetical protein